MTRLLTKLRGRGRGAEGRNANGVSHVGVVAAERRSASRSAYVVTSAESAPCTCPDFCERDHANE
jgi:hypothetical protein